jgi:tetratricopeptide (TPR) repeat protein
MSHNNLGLLLSSTGRLAEAERAYRDALALQKQLAAEFPARPDFRLELARSHNNLGLLLSSTGRLKEAETAYREALALWKQLAADYPTHPEFRQELPWRPRLTRPGKTRGRLLRCRGQNLTRGKRPAVFRHGPGQGTPHH